MALCARSSDRRLGNAPLSARRGRAVSQEALFQLVMPDDVKLHVTRHQGPSSIFPNLLLDHPPLTPLPSVWERGQGREKSPKRSADRSATGPGGQSWRAFTAAALIRAPAGP